jgi:hypothetical protein
MDTKLSWSMFERFKHHATFMPKGQESYQANTKMSHSWLKHASLYMVPKHFLVARPKPTPAQKAAISVHPHKPGLMSPAPSLG